MGKKMMWEMAMKNYMKRLDLLANNTRAVFAIVWGQCSPMIQSKLESLDDCESKSRDCDCVWVLKEIQAITHQFEGTRNVLISLEDAWSSYYTYRQGNQQTLHSYLSDLRACARAVDSRTRTGTRKRAAQQR